MGGRPQQPEINRSGFTPLTPDSIASEVETRGPLAPDSIPGPVPPENRPGHQPDHDQDKPDGDAFVAKMADGAGTARNGAGRPAPEAESGTTRSRSGLLGAGMKVAGAVGVVIGVRRALRARR
jgi:hypothetical protein